MLICRVTNHRPMLLLTNDDLERKLQSYSSSCEVPGIASQRQSVIVSNDWPFFKSLYFFCLIQFFKIVMHLLTYLS